MERKTLDSSKMNYPFSRAWAYSRKLFRVLRDEEERSRPHRRSRGVRKAEAPCSAPKSAGGPATSTDGPKRLEGLGAGAGHARLPPRGKQVSGAKWNGLVNVLTSINTTAN